MKIAIIGLGRMGKNMAKRLLNNEHEVWVHNRTIEKALDLEKEGAIVAEKLEDFLKMDSPRVIWSMLPAGNITDKYFEDLKEILEKGDIIIDGGNSHYKKDKIRFNDFKRLGIHYLDAGISGGVWGLKEGYSTMIGGEKEIYDYILPIIKSLAPEDGYMYCGSTGAGHFVKMVHNGIEYGLMEAYGEGFEVLKASEYGDIDMSEVSKIWNHGSVIRSWLLELIQNAFKEDSGLENMQGYVEDSGEARWTVNAAIETGVSVPIISNSLFKRFQSRQEDLFSDKVVAALRNQFGGHAIYSKKDQVKSKEAGAGKVQAANPQKSDNK
ncbi:MAG: phosphogluconate dehydrogenase (NAD(+)-dependent, decarboxylating) [Thermotogota bacterium]